MKKILILLLFIIGSLEAKNIRVLIGSTVNQSPVVLQQFLSSLEEIEKDGLDLEFLFIDHNYLLQSKYLLEAFTRRMQGFLIQGTDVDTSGLWIPSQYTTNHYETYVWTIAEYKNVILRYGLSYNFDYVFLIDSSILIHPKALKQLIKAKKEIIANIFWRDGLPQVWLRDLNTRFEVAPGESITEEESKKRVNAFISKLKNPGVYEVGGLGACTLIRRSALEKGVSFDRMPNLSYSTEDSHFCIRAIALGIPLYVDTHYPARIASNH